MSDASITAITVPKWGMAMDEGTVTAWNVAEGETVTEGEEVLDVESEKIAAAIEAKAAGVLRRQVAALGSTLPVGALLGVIADEGVSDEEIESFVAGFETVVTTDAEDAGPAVQTVEVDGRSVRYVVQGAGGEPVVLIHGFGGDMNTWMFNQQALAAEREVYAIDLPGHGGSSKEVGDGSLALLQEAAGAVMQTITGRQVHLVGHSLGGALAIALALEHTERVATLSLVAPTGLGAEINGGYITGFVAAERRKDMKPLAQQLFADPSVVTRKLVEDLLQGKRIDGVNAALATLAEAQFEGDRQKNQLASRASDLDIPVQLIWGRDDRIIPCAHSANLPGAQVHVLEDCGHMPMMEKVSEFNALIRSFIA